MIHLNTIFAYALMAAVTLGLANVPHAIYYEHPQLLLDRRYRRDLNDF